MSALVNMPNAINTIADTAGETGASSLYGNESAQVRALLQLREMILAGEMLGGARITELSIVEKLGVSRTPVRAALLRLEQEGLLEALPNGGYAVRSFSEQDITDAIELRGCIEGLMARLAAERTPAKGMQRQVRECLALMDSCFEHPVFTDADFALYVAQNEIFHELLYHMAGSDVIRRQLERVVALPFASPSGFVQLRSDLPSVRTLLIVAQDQHRQVIAAIERREGARAEALMKEHARMASRHLEIALDFPTQDGSVAEGLGPNMRIIRRK